MVTASLPNPSTTLPLIFQDCQKSAATHRRNIVALRKIQQQLMKHGRKGEIEFNNSFVACLKKVLPVKKTEVAGNRVVKFIESYLKDLAEQCMLHHY